MIKRIAIMGCGSLGTILGAYLSRAGLDVTMVDIWEEHVNTLNTQGASVSGGTEMTVPVKACTPDQMTGTFDLFFYMTKQTFNETAIPQMIQHCGTDSIICTCQNGLPELAVAEYYPKEKIMGATVGWPATFLGPGKSKLTCPTDSPLFEFHLGRLTGEPDGTLHEVQQILEKMCPGHVTITSHLLADRWSKIMINATFSGMSTVCADTFAAIINNDRSMICAARIGRECIRVCHAMDITLPSIFGINFNQLFQFTDQAEEQHAVKVIRKYFGTIAGKASMLQDLEKGRKCEIRFINGVVSQYAKKYKIETPYNDSVVKIVSEIESGTRPLQNNLDFMPNLSL